MIPNIMKVTADIFPKQSEIPQSVEVPKIKGRILIGGKILTSGFATKVIHSPCSFRSDSDNSLVFPEIGETPQVSTQIFMQAVDAAASAWAKGRGEWPSARMEERITAVTNLRDKMILKREL